MINQRILGYVEVMWVKQTTPQITIGCTTGWWFGTFFIFPYIGNNDPN